MAKETNYIVIAKQLESGRFLLRFPDFEGITTTAETEETIQTVANSTIKTKLSEMKKAGAEIPEALKIKDIGNTLQEGEFTVFISISNFSFDLKNMPNKENLKEGAKEVTQKMDHFIKGDIKDSVPEGKENLLAMLGGVLSIINTLLFSVLVVNIPFFGKFGIGFFRGLSELSQYSKDVRSIGAVLIFSGIILLGFALMFIVFGYLKNKVILKYTVFGKILFLILFYIILLIKIPSEASEYVSISFFKILLYIISMALVYISCVLMKTEEKQEENTEE